MNLHDDHREESVGLIKAALAQPGLPLGFRKAFNPDQPRDPAGTPEGGQWSGGGGGSGAGAGKEAQPVTVKEAEAPKFVLDFARQYPSIAERQAALKTRSTDHLKTALKLMGQRVDASTRLLRDLVDAELKTRGSP